MIMYLKTTNKVESISDSKFILRRWCLKWLFVSDTGEEILDINCSNFLGHRALGGNMIGFLGRWS